MTPIDIFTAYFDAAGHYAALITPYALHLWYLLMVVEIATIGITWIMGSDDPPELLWRVARWIFTGGFAYWWIINSWWLGLTVLGSFDQLGVILTGQPNLTPMAFIHTATSIAKMLFAAPSTHRLIPDISLAIADFFLSGLIYLILLTVAALAVFTLTAAYVILAGGIIVVPLLVCRFTSPMAEGYFTWVFKTGVVIFFFYLVLGIAQQFAARWNANITAICGPVPASLPSPFLGTAPVASPAVACSAPIPVDTLLTLLADVFVLAFIAIGIPFTAGAIVSHGVNAALEHLAAAKYLAGSVARPIGRAVGGLSKQLYQSLRSDSRKNTLEQRLAAGAAAASKNPPPQSQIATQQLPKPPPVNSFGVQQTQSLPANGAKPTSRI